MKVVRWLQWFSLIWLLCALAICAALLTPVYMASVQEATQEATPLSGRDPAEMALLRTAKRLEGLRRNLATAPDLSGLPAIQAIRAAAAKENVALQVQPLPATGAGPARRAQVRLVARGALPVLTRVLEVIDQQLRISSPLLGIDTWSLRSGGQMQADLVLWTLMVPPRR